MSRKLFFFILFVCSLPLSAAPPKVAVSIGPVHSLVAGVMEGVASPELLIPAGASPHAYALKPSDARALSDAELVIWVGEGLEAVLQRPLRTLAGKAKVLELMELDGITLLPSRDAGVWLKGMPAGHEENDERREHEHGHGDVDTHLWLSPDNARRIVEAVAETLAKMDTANANAYRSNAKLLRERIDAAALSIEKQMTPLQEQPYIVFHDAYHYFEEAFGLRPAGAIAVSPERRPGARRIVEIREAIRQSGARCVFSEPQFRPDIVRIVVEDTGARHAVLDPLGADLKPGKELWFALMRQLGDSLEGCLAANTSP